MLIRLHDTSWTVSSWTVTAWTTESGRVQPVLEEPGTDGPGNVGAGIDGPGSVGPGTDGPGTDGLRSVVIPVDSYRRISNLSKLLESIVVRQLMIYLSSAELIATLQSLFRPGHLTETAILQFLS